MIVSVRAVHSGKPADSGNVSLSAVRALRILSTFSDRRAELGVSELSRELSLSKASVQRFIHALEHQGFLDQNPQTRKYRPGTEIFRIGRLFGGAHQLEERARPLMQDLVSGTGFTCYLGMLRNNAMVIISAIEGPGPIKYSIAVGGRLPLHCTASGKGALSTLSPEEVNGLLAGPLERRTPHSIVDKERLAQELKRCRAAGYALNWEECNLGVVSAAAPILGFDGTLVAVLSIGLAASQTDRRALRALGADVARTAAAIQFQLQGANAPRGSTQL
jgi:DNA-binding IclR family transcriptional regulator